MGCWQLAAIEHLPRSHEAQEHMRRRVNQLKEEAETAEAAHRRRRMQSADGPVVEHTLALLKPDFVQKGDMAIARMLTRLRHEGFAVVRQRKLEPALKAEVAAELYREHQERSFFPKLMDYMASGPAFAIELQAVDAVQKWRDLIGPTDPAVAKVEAPDSLRAKHVRVPPAANRRHSWPPSLCQAASRRLLRLLLLLQNNWQLFDYRACAGQGQDLQRLPRLRVRGRCASRDQASL
jgi:nucleoside diphosphate kinase